MTWDMLILFQSRKLVVLGSLLSEMKKAESVSIVLLRGSIDSILYDLERAVEDGVNTYKAMCRDSRIVPGAAATEIELARRLKEFSFKEKGLDQYAIAKFAVARNYR